MTNSSLHTCSKSHFTVSFTWVNRGLLLASRVHHLQCCRVWYPISPMEDLHWLHRVIIWRHIFTNGVAKSDNYVIVMFTKWNKFPYSPKKNKLMLYSLHVFTAISYDNSWCLKNDFSFESLKVLSNDVITENCYIQCQLTLLKYRFECLHSNPGFSERIIISSQHSIPRFLKKNILT